MTKSQTPQEKNESQPKLEKNPLTPTGIACTSPPSISSRHEPRTPRKVTTEKVLTNTTETSSCSRSNNASSNKNNIEITKTSNHVSPCSRCIELARVFFDSLHVDIPTPFVMPSWVHQHKSFASVVAATQGGSNDLPKSFAASDAMVFAVCGCFTPFDAPTTLCCNFALIRTILSLPATTDVRRRARNVIFELVLHAAAQHETIVLRERVGGLGLLDGLSNSLYAYFISQSVDQPTSGVKLRQSTNSPGSTMSSSCLEERHEAIVCLRVLSSLARQPRNHSILLSHTHLIRICTMTGSHPLMDEQVLTLVFLFVSLCDEFINICNEVIPGNRLIDFVISTMELYADGMLTSLIFPLYFPGKPDKQFMTSICRICLAYARSVDILGPEIDPNAHRLLPVVVTSLLNEETSPFDMAHLVDIARVFALRNPDFAISDRRLVTSLIGMVRHVWAGQAARQTVRGLIKVFPTLPIPQDVRKLLADTDRMDNDGE